MKTWLTNFHDGESKIGEHRESYEVLYDVPLNDWHPVRRVEFFGRTSLFRISSVCRTNRCRTRQQQAPDSSEEFRVVASENTSSVVGTLIASTTNAREVAPFVSEEAVAANNKLISAVVLMIAYSMASVAIEPSFNQR